MTSVDFDMAKNFVDVARQAHAKGDEAGLIAARKLVNLCLGGDEPKQTAKSKELKQ